MGTQSRLSVLAGPTAWLLVPVPTRFPGQVCMRTTDRYARLMDFSYRWIGRQPTNTMATSQLVHAQVPASPHRVNRAVRSDFLD